MAQRQYLPFISLVAAFLAALLAVSVASAPVANAANGFKDVPPQAQFYKEITWLADQGISTGYADNTFRPHAAITRDAMAAFMYRLAGEPTFTPPAKSPFTDLTPKSKFYKEITWLAQTGVTTGYADHTFRPFEPVTRDAMAAFMYRLAGKPSFTAPAKSPFTDVTPQTKFYKEITWLAATGVSTGWTEDKTYRPYWNIARNAMAAFMYRFDARVGVADSIAKLGKPGDTKPTPKPQEPADPTPNPGPTPDPDPRPEPGPAPDAECEPVTDAATNGWNNFEFGIGCLGVAAGSAVKPLVDQGWTVYDRPTDGTVYYVSSSEGSDSNDGLTPETAFKTTDKAFAKYKRGGDYSDMVFFKRGDTFPVVNSSKLNWDRYGGISEDKPFVIATYGESLERPVFVMDQSKTVLGRNHVTGNDDIDYRTLIGIDFYFVNADPNSPSFNVDSTGVGLSFMGNNKFLHFEDLRVRYGHFNLQGEEKANEGFAENYTVRRSAVTRSWSASGKAIDNEQCKSGKVQGMYLSRVKNLLIEDSVFSHNGWSDEVPGYGCANMFNHNIYITGMRDSTIRGNTFLHGASMGLKLSAFGTGESPTGRELVKNNVIENNFFSDSELGISMGGNGEDPNRFIDNVVRGNVFSEMGSDNASNRNFQWALQVIDNDGALVEHNYFVNSAYFSNSFAIQVGGENKNNGKTDMNNDVTMRNNVFYDWPANVFDTTNKGVYTNVRFTDNTLVQSDRLADWDANRRCLVRSQEGSSFEDFELSGNSYSAPGTHWFCPDRVRGGVDLEHWKANYEPTAREFTGSFVDPDRSLTTYGTSLGYSSEALVEEALLNNSKLNWSHDLTGQAINDYVKAGFEVQ